MSSVSSRAVYLVCKTMNLNRKDLLTIFRKTNGHCFYCSSSKASDIDHFFPTHLHHEWELEKYTDNDRIDNLFLSCKSCNSKKGAEHPEDFLGGNFIAWSRYFRANYRVGLSDTREYRL